MTSLAKILLTGTALSLLFLALPLACFGQGFGNFRTDQPFLSATASSTGGTQPDALSNLKFWFKADSDVYKDNGTTLCADGDTVYLWKDKSGNGSDLSQSTASIQPTYQANQINSKPAIWFNNDVMNQATSWGAPGTAFFVIKYNDGSTYFHMMNGGTSGNSQPLFNGTKSTTVSVYFGNEQGTQFVSTPGNTVPFGTWYLLSAWGIAPVAGQQNAHVRTNAALCADATTGKGWDFSGTGLRVGRSSYNDQGSSFNVAEIIYYSDAKTLSEIQGVELYLKNKYGL